jgi:hypothetical protein
MKRITALFILLTASMISLIAALSVVYAQTVPNYSIFVNCVVKDTKKNQYTGYFGYSNNNSVLQELETSKFLPSQKNETPPQTLQPGRHDKIFSVTVPMNQTITWSTQAGDITKSATASSAFIECAKQDAEEKKVTICHATGSGNFQTLTVSENAVYGNGGHFNSNGTPQGGHEGDYFGPCVNPTNSPQPITSTPTNTILPTSQVSASLPAETTTPTLNASDLPLTITPSDVIPTIAPTEQTPAPQELPVQVLPARIDAPRVILNPQRVEFVSFEENKAVLGSACTTEQVNILFPDINSSSIVQLFEYSIDNGKNWYQVTESQVTRESDKDTAVAITTRSLPERTYGITLKAQTANGNVFTSKSLPFVHRCNSTPVVTSAYIKNGFGQSILDKDGEYLVNPYLSAEIYIETIGAIDTLDIQIPGTNQMVALTPIPGQGIWKADITNVLKESKESKIAPQVIAYYDEEKVTKTIPTIVNTAITQPNTTPITADSYNYGIFFKTGNTWSRLDYKGIFGTEVTSQNGLFTLSPGTYFIRVRYASGFSKVTEEFTLSTPSIVRIQTESENPSIFTLFTPLKVSVSSQNDQQNTQEGTIPETLKPELTRESNKPVVLYTYWNRWIPYFTEQLPILERLITEQNVTVYIFTDRNNFDELKRTLSLRESRIIPKLLPDNTILGSNIIIHQDMYIFTKDFARQKKLSGLRTYEELVNEISLIKQ